LKILALNWRDLGHPDGGGAEVHLMEILKRWAARGAEVTLLASEYPGAAREEKIDGIRVLRRGNWWNANWAAAYTVTRGDLRREKFDLVLEDFNKLPYFSPLWSPAPVLTVVPHLFGTTVFAEASMPIGVGVWIHERFLPPVYGKTPFLVISDSTRDDLVARGLDPARIVVSYCGIDHSRYSPGGSKTDGPSVVFVGRLRRYKGVDLLFDAFERLRRDVPDARLTVVGDGPYRGVLEEYARKLRLGDSLVFTGFIPAEEKVSHLRSAWVSAFPSPKEGWGLTVIESNACGTPVVASRSPGLVDSVRDGETGLLVPHGDRQALAEGLRHVLTEATLRERLSRQGVEWASRFEWDRTADEAWQVATAVAEGRVLPASFLRADSSQPGTEGRTDQRTA
jgi:glycosyltransferase involved in cell wall biosynthesis